MITTMITEINTSIVPKGIRIDLRKEGPPKAEREIGLIKTRSIHLRGISSTHRKGETGICHRGEENIRPEEEKVPIDKKAQSEDTPIVMKTVRSTLPTSIKIRFRKETTDRSSKSVINGPGRLPDRSTTTTSILVNRSLTIATTQITVQAAPSKVPTSLTIPSVTYVKRS